MGCPKQHKSLLLSIPLHPPDHSVQSLQRRSGPSSRLLVHRTRKTFQLYRHAAEMRNWIWHHTVHVFMCDGWQKGNWGRCFLRWLCLRAAVYLRCLMKNLMCMMRSFVWCCETCLWECLPLFLHDSVLLRMATKTMAKLFIISCLRIKKWSQKSARLWRQPETSSAPRIATLREQQS